MKAIVTAGGRGTRLRPITWTTNKHLIPLAGEPMLFNAFKKLAAAGLVDVAVNINPGDTSIREVCGDGSRFGLRLQYIEQEGGACGVGQIIWSARDFVGDDDVLLYFGDNIVLGSLESFVSRFREGNLDACLALSQVRDPQRFGVPEFDGDRLVGVEEKPEHPKSSFAVTGIYLYKMAAYREAFSHITPSARGEYEISSINDWLIRQGYAVGHEEITGWWKDTGKPEDLLEGNQLLLNELSRAQAVVHPSAVVAPDASLQGLVRVEEGAVIGPGSIIRGPVHIGRGAVVEKSFVGPHTSIGNEAKIIGTDIEHSIVMDGAQIMVPGRTVDSIIGPRALVSSSAEKLPIGRRLLVGELSVIDV
jgi:glucose-1-phosphate thymidylyltransferase